MDFDFGKYGQYIIPAFAATIVVLGGLTADTLLRARKWRLEAERLQAEKDARKAQPKAAGKPAK